MWIVTLARSRWTSNYYITPATGSSDQLERRCWNENHVPAEAGPPGPRLSVPWERERKAVIARRVGGSICRSLCSVSNSLSHTTISIKWEVYFSKELCPLVFIVLNMFLHAYVYVSLFMAIQQHCWTRKDELISNILLWNPKDGRASFGRPVRTCVHQICADTGCSLEDLWLMIWTNGKRESKTSVSSVWLDDNKDDDCIPCVSEKLVSFRNVIT